MVKIGIIFSLLLLGLLGDTDLLLSQPRFGIHTSALQIMPGDNNSPEPPGSGGDVDEIIRLHKEMGFVWDRCNVDWASVEYPKGTYHWQTIDERLNKIFAAGMQVSVIIHGNNNYDGVIPADGRVPGFHPGAASLDDFMAFVGKCVERYDGDGIDDGPVLGTIKYWEGSNEPVNFYGLSVQQATDFFNQYYAAIKRADSASVVISPSFAWEDSYDYFIPNANAFDMLSVHSNYSSMSKEDPDEWMWWNLDRQDRSFKDLGLGDRPWWVSEFGPAGWCYGDPHLYTFRTMKMYVVARYSMFHTSLISAGHFYCEGPAIAVLNWGDWTLSMCGEATKVYLSIFQDPDIIDAERIAGPDYRNYRFAKKDGLYKMAIWAREQDGGVAQATIPVNGDSVRITDLYGKNPRTVPNISGAISLELGPAPLYLEELFANTKDRTPPAVPLGLALEQ